MAELKISAPLMEMIFSALEEGISTLKLEQGLVTFALLLTKQGVVLRRFSDEDVMMAIERAQVAIAQADDDTLGYAIVYDGQIEMGDKLLDALMIEAGERGKQQGWRFIQRYQAKSHDVPLYAIGDLAYLGMSKNHLG